MRQVESVSTIVSSFPIKELTTIGDDTTEPTFKMLTKLQKELNTNSSSYETTQGTGQHGLIVLTIAYNEYLELATNDIDDDDIDVEHPIPINPGPLVANATVAQARTHGIELYHHGTYHAVDKALKQQLIKAIPDIYIAALHHETTGYATVTTLQMMTHLWETYGEISEADITNNLKNFSEPWHPSTSIEVLFQRIDDCRKFATAGESPIDENTTVRLTYDIFFNTGLFEFACREWRAKDKETKTYNAIKKHFRTANRDRAATTGTTGYKTQTANAIITQQDSIAAMLASHNQLQLQMASLAKAIKNHTNNNATQNKPAESATKRDPNATPTFWGYCHTHVTVGCFKADKIHNSANCKNPGPNHKKEATAENKMGGVDKIWERRTYPKSN